MYRVGAAGMQAGHTIAIRNAIRPAGWLRTAPPFQLYEVRSACSRWPVAVSCDRGRTRIWPIEGASQLGYQAWSKSAHLQGTFQFIKPLIHQKPLVLLGG